MNGTGRGENEAINPNNVIPECTRHAKPRAGYQEPVDKEAVLTPDYEHI